MNWIKENLYSYFTGKYIEGETDLDSLSTPAILSIFKKKITDYIRDFNPPNLTDEQKREVIKFYRRYSRPNLSYHRVYTSRSGRFYPEYMPDDIYFGRVEPFYNDRLFSKYIDNKCLYPLFFSSVKQPETYAIRMGGWWLNRDYKPMSIDEVYDLILSKDECVLKRATFSEGGHGVYFLSGNDRIETFRKLILENETDLVLQESIKQHPAYSALHESSVNTLRFMSLLSQDGVEIFAKAVRIGVHGSRVDNLSSGGFYCGMDDDGRLCGIGALDDGNIAYQHPDNGYYFKNIKLPYIEKAEELIKKAHGIMGHCRIASWDIAIDENADAVLIETNLALGTILSMQVSRGPLFGKSTEKILNEVFYDKKGRKRHAPFLGINKREFYRFKDSLLGIFFGFYKPGYSHMHLLSNAAIRHIDKNLRKDALQYFNDLSREQKKAVRDYYRPYAGNVQTESHRIYTGNSGVFYKEYLPEDLYMCHIDRYLNDRDLAYYLDNKCFYQRLFPSALQPESLYYRIGGIWLDKNYQCVALKDMAITLFDEKEIVVKPATASEHSAGIRFLSLAKCIDKKEKLTRFSECIRNYRDDIVIQRSLKTHPSFSILHPESVNALRVFTLMRKGKVEILSRAVIIGGGKSRVNTDSRGCIYVKVFPDGSLGEMGSSNTCKTYSRHPDCGYLFSEMKLPHIDKCDALVKSCHPVLMHHRLLSWDVTLNEDGEAVLIEVNLTLGSSADIQIVNGPFFGPYTKEILDEVYGSGRT